MPDSNGIGFFVSDSASETVLSPCFVYDDGDAVGQVQAAIVWTHGQTDTVAFGEKIVYLGGEAFGFRTEDEKVSGAKCRCGKQVWPCVVKANMRDGAGDSLCRNASQFL